MESVKLRNPNVGAGGGVFTGRGLNGAAPRRKVTTQAPKGRSMAGRAPLASLSEALQREGGEKGQQIRGKCGSSFKLQTNWFLPPSLTV